MTLFSILRRLGAVEHGIFNVVGTASLIAGAFTLLHLRYFLLTIDGLINIFLACFYQYAQRRQCQQLQPASGHRRELKNIGASSSGPDDDKLKHEHRTIASVVGWREDETLYAGSLRAVASSPSCTAVVAGIDGDEPEDDAMVDVFQKVRQEALES
jgi:hypothetical protein